MQDENDSIVSAPPNSTGTDSDHFFRDLEEEEEFLELLLEKIFLIVNCIGWVENVTAIVILTLLYKKGFISGLSHLMLSQQAFFDAASCALGILVSFHPLEWVSPGDFWNYLLCHAWVSRGIYNVFYSYSVYTHVLLSLDRYLAIKMSIQYILIKAKFKFLLFLFYSFVLVYASPVFLKYFYDPIEHDCYDKIGFVDTYDYVTVIIGYVLPLLLLAYLNGSVVQKLRKQRKLVHIESAGPDAREVAGKALVKISVALGISFIICAAYANIFIVLSTAQLISIPKRSHLGHLSILSINVNMTLNPILSLIFLPSLRKQIGALCCNKLPNK